MNSALNVYDDQQLSLTRLPGDLPVSLNPVLTFDSGLQQWLMLNEKSSRLLDKESIVDCYSKSPFFLSWKGS